MKISKNEVKCEVCRKYPYPPLREREFRGTEEAQKEAIPGGGGGGVNAYFSGYFSQGLRVRLAGY